MMVSETLAISTRELLAFLVLPTLPMKVLRATSESMGLFFGSMISLLFLKGLLVASMVVFMFDDTTEGWYWRRSF